LLAVADLKGPLTAGHVGFQLGPRINAAGRLDDASVGVRLLLTADPEEARTLARELDRANRERQELQLRIAAEAVAQAAKLGGPERRRTLVVSSQGWHPGVVGIVASKLAERFHRPALVLAQEGDQAKGSGRSVEGFHLYDALATCAPLLQRFGGHKHAAGLTLRVADLPAFDAAFEAEARRHLEPEQLQPRLRIDARAALDELEAESARELSRLAPFGAGNPEPVFACAGLTAVEVRVLADKKGAGPGHLKLKLRAGRSPALDAIGFGLGDRDVTPGDPLEAAFQLSLDEWQGVERLQLKLKDVRPSG
jgi:single-stranded-DNA-specific exonuclease